MKKTPWLVGGGIVAVIAIGAWVRAGRAPKITYDTYTVAKETLRQTVQVTGEVVSSQDVDLKFESSGRVTSIARAVGDAVKSGDVLATLDDRAERVDVQKAQAALLSAQASLDRLKNGATAEDLRVAQVTLDNARIALDKARQALSDTQASNAAALDKAYGDLAGQMENLSLKSSAAMQTIDADVFDAAGNLRADISSPDFSIQSRALAAHAAALSALHDVTSDLPLFRTAASHEAAVQLADRMIGEGQGIRDAAALANAVMQASDPVGGTSQASFDARAADVKAVWTDLNAAVNAAVSQKLLLASTTASDSASLNAANAAVQAAEGSVASAQAAFDLKKAPATVYDLEAARAGVTQADAALGAARLALDKTRLHAPYDGTIAQAPGRAGATVTPADVILKLHGANVYEIEADVPETDVAKLKTGEAAVITLDAYGDGMPFAGTLTSIDTAQTVIQDVVYYKTRFRLESPEREIRTGMTANISIVTAERPDALTVPQRAIRQNGEKAVRVLVNGQETKTPVTTGLYGDDGKVEILSGLSGGEQVILAARQNGKIVAP